MVCFSIAGGVVEDDAPSGGAVGEDEGVDAAGISAGGGSAGEMVVSGDDGVVAAEHSDGDAGEGEGSHGGAGGVGLFVAGEDGLVSVFDGFAYECGVGRVVVSAHEGGDVAAVPCGLLIGEDAADGGGGVAGVGRDFGGSGLSESD